LPLLSFISYLGNYEFFPEPEFETSNEDQ
jgi:hypothetical protein